MKKTLSFLFFLIWAQASFAQADSTETEESSGPDVFMISANQDSAFMQARDLAFDEKYRTSRKILGLLILEDPDNLEYRMFRLRTFLWEKKHDAARKEIPKEIAKDTNFITPYELQVLNEVYAKEYEDAIEYCDAGITRFPKNNLFFHTQKAQSYTSMNEYHEALDAVNAGQKNYPDNYELKQLKTFLLNQLIVEGVAVGVFTDIFTKNYNPWVYGFIQYGKLTNVGAFIARLNVAERNQEFLPSFGVQGEIDAYPRLGRKSYGYLNVGYSPSQIYPNFRFGAEYFSMLGNTSLEWSFGIRYLDFLTNYVFMYTGSLGYYWGNNYAQFRPFVISDNFGYGVTFNFTYRRFFSGKGDFLQLIAGGGVVPDENVIPLLGNNPDIENFLLDNQYLGIAYQKIADENFYTRFDLVLTRQENFSTQTDYLGIITLGLTVGYRWK